MSFRLLAQYGKISIYVYWTEMSGKRKSRNSLVIKPIPSSPVSKKSRSHSVNKPLTSSLRTVRSDSKSTDGNRVRFNQPVRFTKATTYVIERIYSLSNGEKGPEITNEFTKEQKQEIEAEIEKQGITCYDDIYNKFNDAYTSRHFITKDEIKISLCEKQAEKLPFIKWSVNNVADHDNKWCKLAGDICMYGAILLVGSFVAKSLGGKKKSKKTKTRKIRRK